jgi:hypothetical protein
MFPRSLPAGEAGAQTLATAYSDLSSSLLPAAAGERLWEKPAQCWRWRPLSYPRLEVVARGNPSWWRCNIGGSMAPYLTATAGHGRGTLW